LLNTVASGRTYSSAPPLTRIIPYELALIPGTRLGPYEVASQIGVGGMGEVYRATDTNLKRSVAIKVLPASVAADAERLVRFQREAEVLAALNHPNIAAIYGLERSGVTSALVMELVEGDDLSQRLARGPIPRDETLPIAKQIADALEAAHEQGIIHRDLKPANIKVRPDGTVKVLDFGLAKAIEGLSGPARSAGPSGLSMSPTIMSPAAMTGAGIILGTAAYMAPEQAKGKAVDKRADIWAFGVVLFEMLTGQTLFGAETISETLAAVIKDPPRLERLPADTPSAIRRLLARCLERDPMLRLRDIGEARILLDQPLALGHDATAASMPTARVSRAIIWTLVAGAIALGAVVGTIAWRAKPAPIGPVRRLELPAAIAAASSFALAPDGSRIAYFAGGHLYVRAFDALDAQDLGAMHITSATPFWSPDSKTIGFTAEGTIRSIPAGGGPVFVICKIPLSGQAMGLAWRTDGTIVFSVWRDSLYKVAAAGGTPEVYVAFDPATEVDVHSVSALPDNRVVVSIHLKTADPSYRVEVVDPSGSHRRTVLISDPAVSVAQYAAQDYLVFLRFGANEGVWAVRFGDGPLDLTKAVLIAPGATAFAAARDGTLVFVSPAATLKSGLVWVDRKGAVSPIAGSALERSRGCCPALSPDGRRAAFFVDADSQPNLVVRDLETGVDVRLTLEISNRLRGGVLAPAWFPSGDRVLYRSGTAEAPKIVEWRADGTSVPREITAGRFARLSPDGSQLLYLLDDRGRGRFRFATLSADGAIGPAQKLWPGDDELNVNWFDLSPDASVLAYAVTQPDGQSNIFLTQFPSGSGRWQVTIDGGTLPRFSRDGRELFHLTGSRDAGGRPRGHFNAVPVTLHPAVKLGVPAILFDEATIGPNGPSLGWFDVARDGRFLMSRPVDPAAENTRRLVLVQNWIVAMGK
jgi:dipeptidyl aminopeptidase/acylaminoacyl peptidase